MTEDVSPQITSSFLATKYYFSLTNEKEPLGHHASRVPCWLPQAGGGGALLRLMRRNPIHSNTIGGHPTDSGVKSLPPPHGVTLSW